MTYKTICTSTWINFKQNNDSNTFTATEYYFTTNSRVLTIQKVTSKELYWILKQQLSISQPHKNTLNKKLFDLILDWKEMYMTHHIVSSNTYARCFLYNILSNALFLNQFFFLFKKSNWSLCSFYKEEDETTFHFYFYCPYVRNLWNQSKC